MKRLASLFFLAFSIATYAQTPATVSFNAGHLTIGAGGALWPDGSKLCVITTDANDKPMGYRVGANGGQITNSSDQADCRLVTGGAIASPITVVNSAASSPLNACIRVTGFDPSGAEIMRRRCVQTGTADALTTWCSNSSGVVSCNFDSYPLGSAPVALMQSGQIGPMGPPGCVVGSTCTSALSPQSVNGVVAAEQMPGNDTGAQINAAFITYGGTSATNPVTSMLVKTKINSGALTVTTPITFPAFDTAGHVYNPVLDCQGGTLSGSGLGTQPMITLSPENALAAANSTGEIRNCTLTRDTAGPIIQNLSRLGFKLTNVHLQGGSIGYQGIDIGTAWGGYQEQTLLSNVSIDSCGQYGISLENTTGTGSYLYSNLGEFGVIKFDLGGTCRVGLHLGGNNAGIFGGRIKLSFNIGSGSDPYYMIKNDGTILSTSISLSGESTGQPTGAVYAVGGAGYTSAQGQNLYRGVGGCVQTSGIGQNAGNHVVTSFGICGATGMFPVQPGGEGAPEALSAFGPTHVIASNFGNPGQQHQVVSCYTDDGTPIWNATSCANRFFTDGKHNTGIGAGWNDSQGVTFTAPVTAGSGSSTIDQKYAASLHFDDIYSPNNYVVSGCVNSSGVAIAPFGSTGAVSINQETYGQANIGQPFTINFLPAATATGTCTFRAVERNPRFTMTLHGTHGSELYPNLTGVDKSEYAGWDASGNYTHTFNQFSYPGQPGTHFIEQSYNAASGGNPFTNFRDCYINGENAAGDNYGGNTCYQPGHQHFGSISTIGNESAVGTTCTIGGYITLTVNDVPRKIAYCQ